LDLGHRQRGAVAKYALTRWNFRSAFTRTELIVAILVVGVLALLAWPTISQALAKRDLARTSNNGREFYLAAFRMATDGVAKADSTRAWPGDYPANSLAEYCGKLVQNDYLRPADLERMLSGPGASCTAAMSGPPATLQLSGKSALKIYRVTGSDPSHAIFAASANYVYDTALDPKAVPFGDIGFVVIRKGGDARIFSKGQTTPQGFDNDPAKFQVEVGALPGAAKGVVTAGDGPTVLAAPR
jgi:type II secretory pathway pseudopilin PulG